LCTVLEEEPFHQFRLLVKSEKYDPETDVGYSCHLKFGYTPNYPDEPPTIEIQEAVNMDDIQVERLQERLEKDAEENLGMVVVFTLVSSANDWLSDEWDTELRRREEEAERRILEAEEAEKKKFHGTALTIENFLAWKESFDAELLALRKAAGETDVKEKKLTGRELFLSDVTLAESDLKFLADQGETIRVDESLFQDLDDLDLDDADLDDLDDEDDPDYDPEAQ